MPGSNTIQESAKSAGALQNKTRNVGEFKCVLCEDVLPSKQELQEHFRQHANKQIAKKPSKTEKFKRTAVQDKDSRLQNVKCEVCDEVLENVTQAINHKYKVHPNCQINHFCGYCGKQFPLEVCKQAHISAEHKINLSQKIAKKYLCKQCSVEFYSIEAVTFHVQSSHKRVNNILTPVATMPPSKKIRKNNSGEQTSVYYCHLCGMEYIVKFNLQKHLEQFHKADERNKSAEELIKCSLCDAIFYNKKAYEAHNFAHTPQDLYLESEQDRKQAVFRVDCDFDLNRVPSLWDGVDCRKRPRVKRIIKEEDVSDPEVTQPVTSSCSSVGEQAELRPAGDNSQLSNQSIKCENPASEKDSSSLRPGGRNRALVDSDTECRSDTSEESDAESAASPAKSRRKKSRVKRLKT